VIGRVLPPQNEAVFVTCVTLAETVAWRGRPALDFTWMAQAACGPDDGHMFMGSGLTSSAAVRRAKRICQDCPVWAACLEYAVATGQREGVWGGRSARQLAIARRSRRAS
jgi:WhiB family redox-sensing transcriptional regulator